jgi:hypothetical protein
MPLTFKYTEDDDESLMNSLFKDGLKKPGESLDLTDLDNLGPDEMDALAELMASGMAPDGLDLQALLEKLHDVREKYNDDNDDEPSNAQETA